MDETHSPNPIKVFRDLVGEEKLSVDQRIRLDELEAYCDELVDEDGNPAEEWPDVIDG